MGDGSSHSVGGSDYGIAMDLEAAVNQWIALLGSDSVLRGDAVQQRYGADASGYSRRVSTSVKVAQAIQLPEVMRIASDNKVAVYPISTGHNWGYGSALPVIDDCVILDLSGLARILDFDPYMGVVTLEPGVTQGMLAEFLVAGNHPYLVPVTGAGPTCSVLANALERGYGVTPIVDHFAAVTDLEAVLADGTVYRTALREAGGDQLARLFKWGIGPYSAGLFSQSGFGIVTQASIVLARRPDCVKVCLFSLASDELLESAVGCVREVLLRLPGTVGAINLMNQHRVLSMTAPYPSDQLDAQGQIPPDVLRDLGRKHQVQPWTGFVTIYGTRRIVAAAQAEIRNALRGVASRVAFFSQAFAGRLARWIRRLPGPLGGRMASAAATLDRSLQLAGGWPNETALPLAYWLKGAAGMPSPLNPSRDGCGLIWYAPLVPMRAESVRAYVKMIERVTRSFGLEPLITLTTLSDKVFDSTVPLLFDRSDPRAVARAQACHQELLQTGAKLGWFPYRVGIDTMGYLSQSLTDSDRFHKALRRAVDPDGLVSPGRYS